jgi:hypothetical protein
MVEVKMRLDEALQQATCELWFRPASWDGSGMAYRLSEDGATTLIGPTSSGKFHAQMTSCTEELGGEWVLIHMLAVTKEA